MSTICVTCLSSERHLIQLQNLLEYTYIWHGVSLQMTDYICWECEAMFNNIWRFKQQVLTAQDVLRNQNLTEIPKVNQCLSKLTKSIKTSYDSEYYEDDVIKSEVPPVVYLYETIKCPDDNFSNKINVKSETEDRVVKIEIEVCSDSQDGNSNKTKQVNDSGSKRQLKNIVKVAPHKFKLTHKEKLFIIKVMTEDELLKARESDRVWPRYKKSPYKCEKCIVGYFNEEQYKNHLNVSHGADLGDIFCKICEVHFSDHVSCNTHTARHYISYQCKVCEFGSHRISVMMVHYSKEHEVGKNYRCTICEAKFISKRLLRYHHDKEHTERPKCTICDKKFSTQTALNVHILIHKRQPTVKCEICKKQFKNLKRHMHTHRKAVTADENAFCAECNVQFKNVGRFKMHLSQNTKHADPNKFPFPCSECGKRFPQKGHLTRHMNAIHYNKKDYVCQICDRGFIRRDRLKEHMLYTHEGESKPRKYMCSYCDRGFTMRQVLVNHIRTHTGERPFECDLCDAKFAQVTALRTHARGVHKKVF